MNSMETQRPEKPSGPAAATILAAGLAAATLGLLTTLSQIIDGLGDWLAFSGRVGMLSGQTLGAVVVYFLSLAGLGFVWRRSSPPLRLVLVVTAVLIVIGLIGTFPPFFRMFGIEE
jgi:hypothetical protein